MNQKLQKNQHIVLVPLPYQGHINPMIQLGKTLKSKGFDITIAHTTYNSPNPKNHPEFGFFPMHEGLPDRKYAAAEFVANDVLVVNENCREILKRLLVQLKEKNVSCVVISDEFMFFAEEVAGDLRLPSLILRTASAATTFARDVLIRLTQGGPISLQGHVSDQLMTEIPPLRYKDLPFTLSVVFESFSTLIGKAYADDRTSLAIIWNTLDCLEHSNLEKIRERSRVPIFDIGPVHMAAAHPASSSLFVEDRTCISWLDKQPPESVIYVSSSGSIGSMTAREVAEIACGLANSQQPFLWVIRPDSLRGAEWTEILPKGFQDEVGDRGRVVKWAPQREVLAHGSIGGFLSHCGWNSTLESLSEGVPMICRPCFGDQRVNTRYLCHVWRVGIELDGVERGEIERAVRKLILSNEGNEMRQRAKEWKLKFQDSARIGGRSYECLNELVKLLVSL